jgi:hypothetical protein
MDSSKINYNCYAFAFDLIDSEEYRNRTLRLKNVFPNSVFCHYLVSNFLNEKEQKELKQGDYIIYFKDEVPSHAGKIFEQKILSKWGTGNLWLHDIYEVPSSFGDDVKFYIAENKLKLQELYKEWALEQS